MTGTFMSIEEQIKAAKAQGLDQYRDALDAYRLSLRVPSIPDRPRPSTKFMPGDSKCRLPECDVMTTGAAQREGYCRAHWENLQSWQA